MKAFLIALAAAGLCAQISVARAELTAAIIGGGEVPIPFHFNRKVELADGENYDLVGRIYYATSIFNGRDEIPYLAVDLEKHPWLANSRRLAFPYYAIKTKSGKFRAAEGTRVRMKVKARALIIADNDKSAQYVIYLEPIEDVVRAAP